MPAVSPWREDAPPDLVVLGAGRCLGATMDQSRWIELGLLTGTRDRLAGHPRLLRSLRFGDDDYQAAVYDVTPWVLGDRGASRPGSTGLTARFPNLPVVSDFLDLPAWLAKHEPAIHSQVCRGAGAGPSATLPDGTVLDAAETAAGRLGVGEMRRQVDRIRRDYADDPEALVGQVKELVESTCKTILGLTGAGPETQQDVPALVTKTLRHLGRHPGSLPPGTDPTEAKALQRIFSGLTSVLQGTAELRNARGTGHGRSGAPLVDPSLARLTAGAALPAVVYLCEAYEASTSAAASVPPSGPPNPAPSVPAPAPAASAYRTGLTVYVGTAVRHSTFGQGQVIETRGEDDSAQAKVRFPEPTGEKWLLLRYAPLQIVPTTVTG